MVLSDKSAQTTTKSSNVLNAENNFLLQTGCQESKIFIASTPLHSLGHGSSSLSPLNDNAWDVVLTFIDDGILEGDNLDTAYWLTLNELSSSSEKRFFSYNTYNNTFPTKVSVSLAKSTNPKAENLNLAFDLSKTLILFAVRKRLNFILFWVTTLGLLISYTPY